MTEIEKDYWFVTWEFEYATNRRTKTGQWNRAGTRDSDCAWYQSKENLLYARIVGKNSRTKQRLGLYQCAGHEYVNFGWVAKALIPFGLKGSVRPRSDIIGIQMIMRDWQATVYCYGAECYTVKHGKDYGKQHLTGFGR